MISKFMEKEGNKFTMDRNKFRDNGDDEMVVSGKKYKVKEVEETMKENMKSENSYFKVSSMRDEFYKKFGVNLLKKREEIKEFVKSDDEKELKKVTIV